MTAARILVVQDEPSIRRALEVNRAARGYDVVDAGSGESALRLVERNLPDLAIVDLVLPGLSGFDVCKTLRSESDLPILVLSAQGDEDAKLRAFDMGADDYVTKPFGMQELSARTRVLLERRGVGDNASSLSFGHLTIDARSRLVKLKGDVLELTPREFDVLAFLTSRAGRVVTHRLILSTVWGPQYVDETQYLRVFINRLRRKIEDDTCQRTYIMTEPSVGYRFTASH